MDYRFKSREVEIKDLNTNNQYLEREVERLKRQNEKLREKIRYVEKEQTKVHKKYLERLEVKSQRVRLLNAQVEELEYLALEPYPRLLRLQSNLEREKEDNENLRKKVKDLKVLVDYLTHQQELLINENQELKKSQEISNLKNILLPDIEPSNFMGEGRKRMRETAHYEDEINGFSFDLDTPFFQKKIRKIAHQNNYNNISN